MQYLTSLWSTRVPSSLFRFILHFLEKMLKFPVTVSGLNCIVHCPFKTHLFVTSWLPSVLLLSSSKQLHARHLASLGPEQHLPWHYITQLEMGVHFNSKHDNQLSLLTSRNCRTRLFSHLGLGYFWEQNHSFQKLNRWCLKCLTIVKQNGNDHITIRDGHFKQKNVFNLIVWDNQVTAVIARI